jgi:hypothetical protein
MTKKLAGTILQKKSEELFLLREKILEGFSQACMGYLRAGKYLMIVRQKQLWKYDGHHVTRFDQWITAELGIGKSSAYNAMNVYDKYGPLIESTPEYQRIDFSHLVSLLPFTDIKSTVDEKEHLLGLVKGQTVQGLKNNLRELAGKTPSDAECEHEETRSIEICVKCNKWIR